MAESKSAGALRAKQRRELIKSDPELYARARAEETERSKRRRQTKTDEQINKDRDQAKIRMQRCRERKKSGATNNTATKPQTRLDEKKVALKRKRNAESQQKRRANFSAQKCRREKDKCRAYYWRKKEERQAHNEALNHIVKKRVVAEEGDSIIDEESTAEEENIIVEERTTEEESITAVTGEKLQNFPNKRARRNSVYRLKNVIRGKNFVGSLAATVRSASKTDADDLKKMGVTYDSPSKNTRQQKEDVCMKSPLDRLKTKRDSESLKAKRIVKDAKKGIFGKASSASTLYKRRLFKRGSVIAPSFIDRAAVHLPGTRGVSRRTLQPKKILDRSLRDLYHSFIDDHPQDVISFATFCRRRPKTIMSYTKTPFRQCRCEICDNPMSKMKAINKELDEEKRLEIGGGIDTLLSLTTCPTEDKFARADCVDRKCANCGPHVLRQKILEAADSKEACPVEWEQWERVQTNNKVRLENVPKKASLAEAVEQLCGEITPLARHRFNARWQEAQYHAITTNPPESCAVVTLDFAENYRCEYQDQSQSQYYSYNQVTLHPVVMHYRCPSCNEVMIDNAVYMTDSLDHSAHVVNFITNHVVKYLQERIPLHRLVIFSDGCSSQYKSKLPFHYLATMTGQVCIERAYFGSRHGKNLCDALGGTVKTAAKRDVAARRVTIRNATDLFAFCQQKLIIKPEGCKHKSRWFHLIKEEEVESCITSDDLKTLPGTRSIHSIRPGNGCLMSRRLSCFCTACLKFDWDNCHTLLHTDSWQKKSTPVPCSPHQSTSSSAFPAQQPPTTRERAIFFAELAAKLDGCSSFDEIAVLCVEAEATITRRFPLRVEPQTTADVICEVDETAAALYPDDAPAGLLPVVVRGDGNCCPRSLSMLVYGNQEHHLELRTRLIVQMAAHPEKFTTPGNFGMDMDMLQLVATLSDELTTGILQTFQAEVLACRRPAEFMGFWQLLATAEILNVPVVSVFPKLGWPVLRALHHRVIEPLQPPPAGATPVFLMWSSNRPDLAEEHWTANHVLPLIPSEPANTQAHPPSQHATTQAQSPSQHATTQAHSPSQHATQHPADHPREGELYCIIWDDNVEYVCQLKEIDLEAELGLVRFMRLDKQKNCYFWPMQDDYSWEGLPGLGASVQLTLNEKHTTQRVQFFDRV